VDVDHPLDGRTAFACWDNRIAPVFDTVAEIWVVQVRFGRIVTESVEKVSEANLPERAFRLKTLGIDCLVCGAISKTMLGLVLSHGIEVVPCVAGDLREIIGAWQSGRLHDDAFRMPGCHRRSEVAGS